MSGFSHAMRVSATRAASLLLSHLASTSPPFLGFSGWTASLVPRPACSSLGRGHATLPSPGSGEVSVDAAEGPPSRTGAVCFECGFHVSGGWVLSPACLRLAEAGWLSPVGPLLRRPVGRVPAEPASPASRCRRRSQDRAVSAGTQLSDVFRAVASVPSERRVPVPGGQMCWRGVVRPVRDPSACGTRGDGAPPPGGRPPGLPVCRFVTNEAGVSLTSESRPWPGVSSTCLPRLSAP